MPSPRGIFIGRTAVQLAALIESAQDRIIAGERTSLSGGGKSGSKRYSMDADEVLFEAQYALDRLNGTARVTRVYQNFSGHREGDAA